MSQAEVILLEVSESSMLYGNLLADLRQDKITPEEIDREIAANPSLHQFCWESPAP